MSDRQAETQAEVAHLVSRCDLFIQLEAVFRSFKSQERVYFKIKRDTSLSKCLFNEGSFLESEVTI